MSLQEEAGGRTETTEEKEVETVAAWTNMYGNTRVFSTTIGHNNATVEDARYLDLVAHGVLWAAGKLGNDGKLSREMTAGGAWDWFDSLRSPTGRRA